IAAVAVAFAKYVGVLVPWVTPDPWFKLAFLRFSPVEAVGLGVIALLTWWNTTSVRNGAAVQNIFTVAKVLSLAGLLVAGILLGARLGLPSFRWGLDPSMSLRAPLFLAFAAATVQPLFSADAWNNVTFLSEEVKQPERNVPRALLGGTVLVCTLYFLTNVGYLNVLSVGEIAGAPQDRVATAAIGALAPGGFAPKLMAAVILVSTFGCLNGLILAGSRVLFALSRDGLFFPALGKVSAATQIPVAALIVQGVWAGALALTGRYGDLLDFVMIAVLCFYVATILGRFRLARRVPSLAPTGLADRLVPAVYIVLVLYVCVAQIFVKPAYPVWSLAIVATGIPAYLVFHGQRRRVGKV
ncbi:MAG TPA: amino acid permease, partial [Thermoanaerobaculia bacterium]|nr:amino acid permease [Thermoanaerobaculia bacterium]